MDFQRLLLGLTISLVSGVVANAEDGEPATAFRTAAISVESNPAGKRVLVDDELFAEYVIDTGRQPAVWPIHGPSGLAMTRSWPLGPRGSHEEIDHPHHESLWFSHGGVNGHDFWAVAKKGPTTHIVHQEFLRCEAVDDGSPAGAVVIETANDWNAGDETILTDKRRLTFGLLGDAADSPRYIDFQINLIASEGAATFADTKEGTFGVRVPGVMKVDAKLGGKIRNSRGQLDEAAWGQAAEWVDYHGPLSATTDPPKQTGGIVIMAHPDAFRPECRWHVRTYGLFAANPFGKKDFPAGTPAQGAVTLDEGETLSLRYRVVFYTGDVGAETIGDWFDTFASTTGE